MLIGKKFLLKSTKCFLSSKPLSVMKGKQSTLSICRPRINSNKGRAPCSGCQLPEKRKNKFQ